MQPDDPSGYNNRGSAYFYLGGADNLQRALADFDRAVALAPDDPTGYYNRGLAYIRLDDGARWRADLERALAQGHPGAHEALCWGYSLSEDPTAAVDHCLEALKAGAAGPLENLGVAYARIGRLAEARSELAAYRDKLAAGEGASAAKMARLDEWLTALGAGKNPFDAEALKTLREE